MSPTAKSCSTGSPSARRPSNATPGHCETNLNEFRDDLLTGRYEPLDVPGDVLTVDTTDLDTLSIEDLAAELTALQATNQHPTDLVDPNDTRTTPLAV